MNRKTAKALMVFGIYLILAGVAGYLSNPEKAKTALMSGGTFGSLSIFFAWLGFRNVSWSLLAAKLSTGFLAIVFVWRSYVTWGKVFEGAPEKMFAAGLITSMLIASVITIIILFKNKKE